MDELLAQLKSDHPHLTLTEGKAFSWSPKNSTIMYKTGKNPVRLWSLLHEVAHGLLGHAAYETDFELLLLEVAAWDKAKELAGSYGIAIDEDHIQDCLDTYRDWLYQRAACPTCTGTSLQDNATTYRCFNCGSVWTVTSSRMCRPYRLTSKQQKTPSGASKGSKTTFL